MTREQSQIQALRKKQQRHQELADAYAEGIKIARDARHYALVECKYIALDRILEPKTCRHPAARLSPETKIHNESCKALAKAIERLIDSNKIDQDDDIPF